MIELILRRVRALDVPGLSAPSSGVVVGMDRDPLAKVTLLLFDERGRACAVAKVARDPASEPALHAESRALARLGSAPLGELAALVPRLIAFERMGERLVLVTSAIPASPLSVTYYTPGHVGRRDAVAHDFAMAGRWLAAFQQATTSAGTVLGAPLYDDHVAPVLARYDERFGSDGWQREALATLEADTRELPPAPLALCTVHGDYAIGNVLVSGGRLAGVIDWELSRHEGLPLTDVLKFAASYSSYLDRAVPPRRGAMRGHPGWTDAARRWSSPSGWSNLTGFLYGFVGSGWYPELVRGFVREHAARLQIPDAAVSVLLRTFVAEQATTLANAEYGEGYRELLRELHVLRIRDPRGASVVGSR